MAGLSTQRTNAVKKPKRIQNPLSEGRAAFQEALVGWFQKEGRHELPWRQTTDPYEILVSEFMLQQTQITTVLERGFYTRWLKRFPDPATLAVADEADVLKHWEGLGYYNRARNLQKAARTIIEEFGGTFPDTAEAIQSLPGVGRYTAGAVASIAFGESAPVVDGNVIRVFARVFDFKKPVNTTAAGKQFWQWAEALVPENHPAEFNAGLMELGQRICTKGSPSCDSCPIASFCKTRDPDTLPVKTGKPKTVFVTEHAIFLEQDGRLLLEQETGSRRKGLWKLPLVSESDAADLPILLKTKYAITHHRVELIVQGWISDPTLLDRNGDRCWFDIETELSEIAMSAPFRRAVETVLQMKSDSSSFHLES